MAEEEKKDRQAGRSIAELLAMGRPWTLSGLAEASGMTEIEVARSLPEEQRVFTPGSRFEEVWAGLAQWEKATFFVEHCGHVLEIQGRLNAGKSSRGYYNIFGSDGLTGHLQPGRIADICFLSMPFMGKESHSVQFFNADGGVDFSVYLGRKDHEIIPSVRDAFMAMRAEAAAK